jgi:adenylate cyclase
VNFPPDAVVGQLERILASPGFASADRASRFLRYVVERTIAGEGDQLKEYVIGRAVFDRDDDYDPRIDSIVRVEAGRLRSKIDEYYAGPGREDAILIQLRRGSYVPAFESRESRVASTSASPSRVRRNLIFVAAGLVIVALVAWKNDLGSRFRLAGSENDSRGRFVVDGPSIVVLPFSNYSMDPAERMLAARVTDGITAELARLGTLGVVSHTTALQYAETRPPLREIAKTLNAQYVLEGKVRAETGRVSIQVVLVDASLDRKVWVHDASGSAADIPEMQRQLAQGAAAAIRERK